MKRATPLIDVDEIQKAFDRAAYNALFGPQWVRAGRFDNESPELKKETADALRRILLEHGFEVREIRHSHEIWHHPGRQKSVVVPDMLSTHNANAALIHVGLPRAF